MPLTNFGSILSFAEEIETHDRDYFKAAVNHTESAERKALFGQFADDAAKNLKTIQRTRRENVTEMILEGIDGFTREPFLMSGGAVGKMSADEMLATARRIENRAIRYYREAAEKLKAQPEVARVLKQLSKTRQTHLDRL